MSGSYFGPGAGAPAGDYGEPVYVPEPPPPGFPVAGYPGYPVRPYQPPAYGPPPPQPDGPAPPRNSPPILGWLLLGAATLAVLGAVLPWATVYGVALSGVQGDGRLVLGCAAVIIGCGLAISSGRGRLWAPLTALVFALLIALLALINAVSVGTVVSDAGLPLYGHVAVGGGLWLTLIAGILASGVAALAVLSRTAGAPPYGERPGPAA